MPFFAFAHWFAFSHTDYIDKNLQYCGRMPFYYAFRDAFGPLDVIEDSRATLRGGVDYRTFEPVEGGMHQGVGRERRIRAGLRYAKGGRQKYWIPTPKENTDTRHTGPISALRAAVDLRARARAGYAPLMEDQADHVFTDETASRPAQQTADEQSGGDFLVAEEDPVDELEYHDPDGDEWTLELGFEDPDAETERVFAESRKFMFGDYHYPCIDVSGEDARRKMWDEEERILRDQRAAFGSPTALRPTHPSIGLLAGSKVGYGAVSNADSQFSGATNNGIARSQSDPDPRAAQSAVERAQKGRPSRKGVYGGWAEGSGSASASASVSPSSSSNGFVHPPTIITPDGHPVIDYTPETAPEAGDVGLRYSKTAKRPEAPRIQTSPNAGLEPPRASSSASRNHSPLRPKGPSGALGPDLLTASNSDSKNGRRSDTPSPSVTHVQPEVGNRSRHNSSVSNHSSSTPSPGTPLPSDAIDLVVEDVEAEQGEMTRERRKGEPGVRATGERRIYRREYFVKDPVSGETKDVEVEVEEEAGVEDPRRGAADAVDKRRIKVRDVEPARGSSSTEESRTPRLQEVMSSTSVPVYEVADDVPEEEITRVVTPPPHVHEDSFVFKSPPILSPDHDAGNPWA